MRWLLILALTIPSWAQLPVPLEAKESTWVGSTAPINAHSSDPATFGIVLADSDGITCGGVCTFGAVPSNLRLENSAHTQLPSQFRVTEFWPHTGNAKLVIVDEQTSQAAGAADYTGILCKTGVGGCGASGGNFGGADLVTDNQNCAGTTDATRLCVNTGTAKFQLLHANFNLFDDVQDISSGTHIIAQASHGTNDGVVVQGPATGLSMPAEVSCLNGTLLDDTQCTTLYLSNADSTSTYSIVENGPLRARIKFSGNVINSGSVYYQWTVYETFWKGKNWAGVEFELRNAQTDSCVALYSSTNTHACDSAPNTAYKMFRSAEIRVTQNLAITGSRTVTFAGAALPQPPALATTSLTAGTSTDGAYFYQGFSNLFDVSDSTGVPTCSNEQDQCVFPHIFRTSGSTYAQNGWVIKSTQTITGTVSGVAGSQAGGFADIEDSSHVGTEIGLYESTLNWPNSLEYRNDGKEIRIGFLPDQLTDWTDACTTGFTDGTSTPCHIPYAVPWTEYFKRRAFFDFHAASIAASSGEADQFLKWQHMELLRPTPLTNTVPGGGAYAYLNNAVDSVSGIYALIFEQPDPVAEDNYYKNLATVTGSSVVCTGTAGTCEQDVGSSAGPPMKAYQNFFNWQSGGGGNDHDFGLGNLLDYEYRGLTGRFILSRNFYDLVTQSSYAHSDFSGGWRGPSGCPTANCPALTGNYNGSFPDNIPSINGQYGTRDRIDNLHDHNYGYPLYVALSGDEPGREQLEQGWADDYLNQNIAVNNPTVRTPPKTTQTREAGHRMANASEYSIWMRSTGDANKDGAGVANHTALLVADNYFALSINQTLALSGYGGTQPCVWGQGGFYYTGSNASNVPCSHGVSPVRGVEMLAGDYNEDFLCASTQTNITSCNDGTAPPPFNNSHIRTMKPLFTGILNTGLHVYQSGVRDLEGDLWSYSINGGVSSDVALRSLEYATAKAMHTEDWLQGSTQDTSGMPFFVELDFLNGLGEFGSYSVPPACGPGSTTTTCTSNPGSNIRICDHGHCACQECEASFSGAGDTTGSVNDMDAGVSWEPRFETWAEKTNLGAGQGLNGDAFQFVEQAPVLYVLHKNDTPAPTQLKTLGIISGASCSSSTSCTITWTPPTDVVPRQGMSLWLKYTSDGTSIVPWLNFNNHETKANDPTDCAVDAPVDPATGAPTGCFGIDPATNTAFFAAQDVATEPANTGTYTLSGLNAANTYHFALMYFGNGAPPANVTLSVVNAPTSGGSITSTDGHISCGSTCSFSYTTGASVTLTATASATFAFSSWTNCDTPSGNTCNLTMNTSKTVTANYVGAARNMTGVSH